MWLLDAETGETRRIGPRWRDCHLPGWGAGGACWSPDGGELLLISRSMFELGVDTRAGWYSGVDEHLFRVSQGTAVQTARWRHPVFHVSQGTAAQTAHERRLGTTGRWLGNGTRTVWTSEAWEFADGKTGKTTRCLHPRRNDPVDGKWHDSAHQWLDRAIATVALGSETEGARTCHYWRTAPDLARTERRDYSLPAAMPTGRFHATFSKDEKWLLLERQNATGQPLWLLSLVDGRCQPLLRKSFMFQRAFFTPDSGLLVIPSGERLHAWNLAEGRWEPGVGIADFAKTHGWPEFYTASPGRPWRVALVYRAPMAVLVANLEEQTTTRADATPPFERYAYTAPAHWLGDDRLLITSQRPARLWILEADGSGGRQVLP